MNAPAPPPDAVPQNGPAPAAAAATLARFHEHLRDGHVGGRRVRYLDIGEGPPVMLIHGIGCNWAHWALNLDAIAAAHRVIAVDLPGFGASEALEPRSELSLTARALLELADGLGLERFAVVGHSLGGLVAWLMTTLAPERIRRLVLVDSATVALNAFQIATIVNSFALGHRALSHPGIARAVLRRPRLRRLVINNFFADRSGVTPELAVALLSPFTAAPGFREALWAAPRATDLVEPESMATPTLVVWGTRDLIFSVKAARHLVRRMPDATLLEVPGARHWPHFEAPGRFNAAVVAFLAEG